jgi:hypothetical protein
MQPFVFIGRGKPYGRAWRLHAESAASMVVFIVLVERPSAVADISSIRRFPCIEL